MLRELDFVDLLAKEVYKKRLWQGVSFVLLVLLLFVLIVNALKPIKTIEDMAREYVVCRLSYTPEDVDRAYLSCPYQDRYVGLEAVTKLERDAIRQRGIYSFFYPEKVVKVGSDYHVDGVRVVKDEGVRRVRVVLGYTGRGFILKEVQ